MKNQRAKLLKTMAMTKSKRLKLYVSLPISGFDMDYVRTRCEQAREKYILEGYDVVTPLDLTKHCPDAPYNVCIGRCIEALLSCDKAVFLVGAADSKGCRVERYAASIYGISTFYDDDIR